MSEKWFAETIINEERARCAKLAKMLAGEPEFLVYCIETPVYPDEDLEHHRQRFSEYDEFGDLM
jgi:hypothetical protein